MQVKTAPSPWIMVSFSMHSFLVDSFSIVNDSTCTRSLHKVNSFFIIDDHLTIQKISWLKKYEYQLVYLLLKLLRGSLLFDVLLRQVLILALSILVPLLHTVQSMILNSLIIAMNEYDKIRIVTIPILISWAIRIKVPTNPFIPRKWIPKT